jgi:hypothetical protein
LSIFNTKRNKVFRIIHQNELRLLGKDRLGEILGAINFFNFNIGNFFNQFMVFCPRNFFRLPLSTNLTLTRSLPVTFQDRHADRPASKLHW